MCVDVADGGKSRLKVGKKYMAKRSQTLVTEPLVR